MKITIHFFKGVGHIHGRRGRWFAATIYGEKKGPFRHLDKAQDWLDIHWARASKTAAGVGWRDK